MGPNRIRESCRYKGLPPLLNPARQRYTTRHSAQRPANNTAMPKTGQQKNKGQVLLERAIQDAQHVVNTKSVPLSSKSHDEDTCLYCYKAFVQAFGPCKHQRPAVHKYVVSVRLPVRKDECESLTDIVKAESADQAERIGKRMIWDHLVQKAQEAAEIRPDLATFDAFLSTYDDWVPGCELNAIQQKAEARDAVEFEQLVTKCLPNVEVYALGNQLKGSKIAC